jgi:lysophospholipase L1-like esterase
MKTSVRAGPAGVLAFGTPAVAIAVTRHEDGVPAPPKGPYVALGDSYTAGPKIPGQSGKPADCDRSDRNYPALVARRLGLAAADFRDVSCSGATIAELSAPQSTDRGTNPAQLSNLSARTRLVTLGIGGNDIGFASVVEQCVKTGLLYYATGSGRYLPGGNAPCRGQYASGSSDEVRQKIEAADGRLSRAVGAIAHRAPNARVYVVGYPAILPAGGPGCGRAMGLAPGDVGNLHQKEQELNAMLRRRAEDTGAEYVDTYEPSVGRDACAARDVRWIEPLVPRAPAAAVHPDERGERGMADAVLESLEASD